jgi:hypothetical protein
MKVQFIETDRWEGQRCFDTRLQRPSWEIVERAIRSLDANRHTCVSLLGDNDCLFVVGGGAGRFVLSASPNEDTHLTALNLSAPLSQVELTIGGQTGIYMAQMVVDEAQAIQAARTFCESNTLEPSLTWSTA